MTGTTVSPASATEFHRTPYFAAIGQVLCVIIPLVIWFAPLGLAPQVQHGFAILAFMVIAWITEATEPKASTCSPPACSTG